MRNSDNADNSAAVPIIHLHGTFLRAKTRQVVTQTVTHKMTERSLIGLVSDVNTAQKHKQLHDGAVV